MCPNENLERDRKQKNVVKPTFALEDQNVLCSHF